MPTAALIPRAERLIVALDVSSAGEAKKLVERLGDAARFYKVGLELFTSGGAFELIDWLTARGCKVFADYKLYDIPETVRRAIANLRGRGVSFVTVHGHRSVMESAAEHKGSMKVLAVTVLTSFDKHDLAELGSEADLEALVLHRARGAAELGCDGVVASGQEAVTLKKEFGPRLLIVVPGIRPAGTASGDQKRIVDPSQAFRNGADYIVVGRPIRDAADPRAAAEGIQKTISTVFPA